MKPATLEFVRQRFSDYYRKAVLVAPPSIEQREWGFVLLSQGFPEIHMRRHIGFAGRDELFDYVRNLVPAHAYYSSAYYEEPNAPTMKDKRWLGADLIFDLDADHLMRGPYDVMLRRVKEETQKLLAMLTGEFGIDQKTIDIVFSGGRGYHVHVKDIAFRSWGSAERRELIDYVCGIGIDPVLMLAGKTPPRAGWQVRYREALLEYLRWLATLEKNEALAHLAALPGIGKVIAEDLLNQREAIIDELMQAPSPLMLK
jgi:DNA primase small subunit